MFKADTEQGVAELLNLNFNRLDSWPVLTNRMQKMWDTTNLTIIYRNGALTWQSGCVRMHRKPQFLVVFVCEL